MSVNHAAVAALPITSAASQTLVRNIFVARMPYVLADADDMQTIVAVDPTTGAVIVDVLYLGRVFHYDSTDTTTAHDGTTCLVSYDSKRYKLASGTDVFAYSVLNVTTSTPPGSPTVGDAYLIAAAPTGAWSGKANYVTVYTARGWEFVLFGIGRFVYDEDTDSYYHKTAAGTWIAGFGTQSIGTDSVPLSSIIGLGASPTIRVENQTTEVPPGSRVTGGTPTVPLGGTAANINDNTAATTSVTSALGDLSAATVASRIIAKLDLGSSQSLIGIEVKSFRCSTGSSGATGCGLYYSTDNTNWTQLGTGFQATTVAADFRRTGTVTARYVALVTDAKAWSTATNTLGDLNAYSTTITASVGTAYVIGPNPIGTWAANAGNVAICEVANTFTIYTPAAGDEIYDKSLLSKYQFTGTAWQTLTGNWICTIRTYAADATWTKPARLFKVRVTVIASGGSGNTSGGTSSFGSHCQATGGTRGDTTGAGGVGSGGDLNITGLSGVNGGIVGGYGTKGAGTTDGGGVRGGAGGMSVKEILAASLGSAETVTVTQTASSAQSAFIIVEEFTNT